MQDAEEISISIVDQCWLNKLYQFTHLEDSLTVKVESSSVQNTGRGTDERSWEEEEKKFKQRDF